MSAGLARLDRARGEADGVQARAAQAVHRGAGHRNRQAREQPRHARHVAVVLAGLVGAAVEHVVHGRPVDAGVALHQRLDGHGAQVVGAHAAQGAAVAAEGGADGVADKGLGHGVSRDDASKK